MQTHPTNILDAIDAFTRKYYKNIALRGVIYAVGIAATLFLATTLLEHFGWLSSGWRGVLFWGGIVAVVAVLVGLVAVPLLKMHGLGRRISRKDAARMVGKHFPEVSDKLLNLLQLMDEAPDGDDQSSLLAAAIEQKAAQMRPVPMLSAIDLKANKRYLKYALPPIGVIVLLLFVSPRTITEPTRRIANYHTAYSKPAPFAFRVVNERLEVQQGDDYELHVVAEGSARPAEAWLRIGERRYRMQGADTFSYAFRHVHSSVEFVVEGGGVTSEEHRLEVLHVPQIVSLRMLLSYPAYTKREAEVIDGMGDATVPEGTWVRWVLAVQNADSVYFLQASLDSSLATLDAQNVGASGRVEINRRMMAPLDYALCVGATAAGGGRTDEGRRHSDTLHYRIEAIPDAAPQIGVEEIIDSARPERRIFKGRIRDDYGFSKLIFVHTTTHGHDTLQNERSVAEIALSAGEASQEFYFTFNAAELSPAPSDEIDYWFEVSDNDAIHGPKTTRSQQFAIKSPTETELDSILAQGASDIQSYAHEQMEELARMQQEINELMRKFVDKKELSWQDKKELEQLADKQRKVQQMMQQMQQQIKQNNHREQMYREQSEQLMEKQLELNRLMNEVMDEKMKQTLAEIDQMIQKLDKNKVQQELEKLKMDNAELSQQLDQNINLMKQLELDKRVEETIRKMDKLAEEQRAVSRETEKANPSDRESLMQRQDELSTRYKQLEQDISQLEQQYKELDPSVEFHVPEELQKKVEQEQHEAKQGLEKGDNDNASKMQRDAADDMERLSEAIAKAQIEAEQEGLAEDAEQIRRLLKNLVQLSMHQEELIADIGNTYIQDPQYQNILLRQNRLKDDFRNVEDSLRAVARRQVQVASVIDKEVSEVNSGIRQVLSGLLDMNQSFYGNYKNTQAARPMQYSMTALNNLALVLAESLDKMQSQMRQNSKRMANGQCKNPGAGKRPSASQGKGRGNATPQTMRQLQQELNRQMEALRKQLEKEGKQGNKGRHQIGQGQQMSQELSQMAAKQEAIRRMMQQYGQELKEAGGGDPALAREIDQLLRQMEQTESDLVNRTITRQTIMRQQQIETRLLEHEKAELQREREERRESREAEGLYGQPSPAELQQYDGQKQSVTDPIHTVPPSLTPYYRDKVNEYFYKSASHTPKGQ